MIDLKKFSSFGVCARNEAQKSLMCFFFGKDVAD